MKHSLPPLAILAALCAPSFAQATWYVDSLAAPAGDGSPGAPFVQIAEATAAVSALDVVLVAPGLYEPFVSTVPISVIGPVAGDAIVAPTNASPLRSSVIRGDDDTPGASIEVRGLTFDGEQTSGGAGGINIETPVNIVVRQCSFQGLRPGTGTGNALTLYNQRGNTLVEECSIVRSEFAGSAVSFGAIASTFELGSFVLRDCLFEENFAFPPPNFGASLISVVQFVGGTTRVEDCVFRRNQGISILRGDLTTGQMIDCLFDSNRSPGGLVSGALFGQAAPSLVRCVLRGPKDTAGLPDGNLLLWVPAITDCTIIGNPSGVRGPLAWDATITRTVIDGFDAGPFTMFGNARLRSCTLYGTASVDPLLEHVPQVWNTIVERHRGPVGGASSQVLFSNLPGGPSFGPDNIDATSEFYAPLAGDLRLGPGSPCIDAGGAASNDPNGSPPDIGALRFDGSAPPVAGSYCPGKVTSEGCAPELSVPAVPSVSAATGLDLTVDRLPDSTFGLFFIGPAGRPAHTTNSSSPLCIGSGAFRTQVVAPTGNGTFRGTVSFSVPIDQLTQGGFAPGDALHTQFIARDPLNPDGTGITFSNALQMLMLP